MFYRCVWWIYIEMIPHNIAFGHLTSWCIWMRSQRCGSLVTWFCYYSIVVHWNLYNETGNVLIKTHKFHQLPGTVFSKSSCLTVFTLRFQNLQARNSSLKIFKQEKTNLLAWKENLLARLNLWWSKASSRRLMKRLLFIFPVMKDHLSWDTTKFGGCFRFHCNW